MAEVRLEKVNKVYDNQTHVIKDVSLDVADQEFLVLVGPSGCGKSTMLRMIAGLEEITSGKIYIGERLVNDLPPKDRDIAMVFQNYALYPHMNVFDNMAFGLKMRKFPTEEITRRVTESAEILGLSEYLQHKPKQLSGGQRQRVALGRAIVRKPKVFLFDEPLSNLDAKLRVHMRTEISKLHNRLKTTMIYVTHDQVEAMTMGDRIAVLRDGIIQQCDTPLNLYHDPQNLFVAGFIGSPAMNFIHANVQSDTVFFDNIQFKIPASIGNDNVIVGIRPESFIIDDNNPHFKAEIEVVEPMGNEIFLYFTIAEKEVVARILSNIKISVGDIVPFRIDIQNVKFFDPKSEKRVRV
ncbi:glycerol-3-phosphate ABC transporter ATP-binding protein [bacterium]|nr:MAG: glycerol-3-phosphate ABC transporter ATP-binding protein [bacterium]